MEKQTVFIKRYPSRKEFPKIAGYYDTNVGRVFYVNEIFDRPKKYYPSWWLEEIELPSENNLPTNVALHHNTMYHDNNLQESWNKGVIMCYEYLITHLK